MKLRLPNLAAVLVDTNGRVVSPWVQFFQGLVNPPAQVEAVTLTGSPFDYTVAGFGTVLVSGGTVSAIALVRGGSSLSLGVTSGLIPVGDTDVVRITYTVAPTVTFIPG